MIGHYFLAVMLAGGSVPHGTPPKITTVGSDTTITINSDIGYPPWGQSIVNTLNKAKSSDVVRIVITTRGGSATTEEAITEAMDHTKATVITEGKGLVASAGAYIFIDGRIKQVDAGSYYLFHRGSCGDNYGACPQEVYDSFIPRMDQLTGKYLTKEERKKITKDDLQLWLGDSDMANRITLGQYRGYFVGGNQ